MRSSIAGLILLAGLFALQTQLYEGQERVVTSVFMFVALAQSWNLIGGLAGYASFGQVVFFGLGGYTTAVVMQHAGWSFWAALAVSGALCCGFGAVIGLPLLRLRGHYFAIATLGVAEGMREVVTNLPGVTGGGAGISVPMASYPGNDGFYVIFLCLAAFAVLVGGLVARSGYGYSLRAIHQDEDAAASMGVNTTRAKTVAFSLSGLIGGLVGSAYAYQLVTIYPQRLFDVQITVLIVIMVVIGGSGTVAGPLVGAALLELLSEWLRLNFTDLHTIILGVIIIAFVILLPEGLVPFVKRRELSLLANVRRYRL